MRNALPRRGFLLGAGAGAFVPALPMPLSAAAPSWPRIPTSDRPIIAWAAEHKALTASMAAMKGVPDDDPTFEGLITRQCEIERALGACVARTIHAMNAKASVLAYELDCFLADDAMSHLARSIADDLRRATACLEWDATHPGSHCSPYVEREFG